MGTGDEKVSDSLLLDSPGMGAWHSAYGSCGKGQREIGYGRQIPHNHTKPRPTLEQLDDDNSYWGE